MQYDNPCVIMLRDGRNYDYPKTELNIDGKKIYSSSVTLQEGDVFIAMSDGCPHAGIGIAYNFGWKVEEITDFMEAVVPAGYTAKTLSTMLVDECNKLYGFHPGDDATACVVRVRRREPMNILFGPPRNRDDCDRMMSLFFSKDVYKRQDIYTFSTARQFFRSFLQIRMRLRARPPCRKMSLKNTDLCRKNVPMTPRSSRMSLSTERITAFPNSTDCS